MRFEPISGELETLEERIQVTNENLKSLDKKLGEIQKKRKKSQAELESYRLREREIADKIEEDAKELEKMASKQTVLQVSKPILSSSIKNVLQIVICICWSSLILDSLHEPSDNFLKVKKDSINLNSNDHLWI